MKPSFWIRPLELSSKDVLAIAFSGTFLFFCWRATVNKDALEVVKTLVPLIGIVLGGYFVQESAAMWFMRSQGMQQPYYGGYYGSYGYNMMPSTEIAPEAQAPADSPEKPTI